MCIFADTISHGIDNTVSPQLWGIRPYRYALYLFLLAEDQGKKPHNFLPIHTKVQRIPTEFTKTTEKTKLNDNYKSPYSTQLSVNSGC